MMHPMMFQGGDSVRWVAIWPDHREVYQNFTEAKNDLLNMLWFWSRDFLDADPRLSDDIMKAWDEASGWSLLGWTGETVFHTHVRGDRFTLVKLGAEVDHGLA